MSHPAGSRLAALVDGNLRLDHVDDVVDHLVACPSCRERVLAERATRNLLCAAADVAPSEQLTARLLAMTTQETQPAGSGWPGPEPSRRLRRPLVWLGTAVLGGATAVGGLYLVGGELGPDLGTSDILLAAVHADSTPENARAASESLVVEVTAAGAGTGDDPTSAALSWMREERWSTPALVPATLALLDLRRSPDGVLVMELAGGGESRVVVLEWRGTLDASALSGAVPLELGGGDAYLVSTTPWTAVKQSGEVVVAVVCHGPVNAGRQVMAAIPHAEPQTGPAARIGRGWGVLTTSAARVVGR